MSKPFIYAEMIPAILMLRHKYVLQIMQLVAEGISYSCADAIEGYLVEYFQDCPLCVDARPSGIVDVSSHLKYMNGTSTYRSSCGTCPWITYYKRRCVDVGYTKEMLSTRIARIDEWLRAPISRAQINVYEEK